MIFALVCIVLFVVVWRLLRARRAGVLAGRNAEKPVYSVTPPRRRLERPSRGVL